MPHPGILARLALKGHERGARRRRRPPAWLTEKSRKRGCYMQAPQITMLVDSLPDGRGPCDGGNSSDSGGGSGSPLPS